MSAPVTTITIGDRVAKGAALLDEKLPGWDKDIDLDRLNLASPCRCILGQLHFNENDPGVSYADGIDAVGIRLADDVGHGFNLPGYVFAGVAAAAFDELTDAWKRLILARREAVRP